MAEPHGKPLVLTAGPFTRPARPWLSNLALVLTLSPAWLAGALQAPETSVKTLIVGLAFSFLPLLTEPRNFSRNLRDLYWLAAMWPVLLWSPWPDWALAGGAFLASLLAVNSRLLKCPPPPSLWGLAAALALSQFFPPHPSGFWAWSQLALLAPYLIFYLYSDRRARLTGLLFLPSLAALSAFLLWKNEPEPLMSLLGQSFLACPLLASKPFYAADEKFHIIHGVLASAALFLFLASPTWPPLAWLALNVISRALDSKIHSHKFSEKTFPPKKEQPHLAAALLCRHQGRARPLAEYEGGPSCRLARQLDEGFYLCRSACLALGDCLAACPHKAIRRNAQTGFIEIEARLCRGCGACLAVCPKNLLVLAPRGFGGFINCSHQNFLKEAGSLCPGSCLGCGRCRKACPAGAISRLSRLGAFSVNKDVCRAYGPSCLMACGKACPKGVIEFQSNKNTSLES